MIHLNFTLRNPWGKPGEYILLKDGKTPFKNKFWELQINEDDVLICFGFSLSFRTSHSGFSLELGLLGYWLNFTLYDSRHWDYEHDRYFEKENA